MSTPAKGRPFAPPERLWDRVDKGAAPIDPVDTSACWLWTGGKDQKGYGLFSFNGVPSRVHRVAFVLCGGEIAPGQVLLHKCDTRACVRFEHLTAGSVRENNADRALKGRNAVPLSRRLTLAEVVEIRAGLEAAQPKKALARRYGVSATLIRLIAQRKIWRSAA